MLTSFADVGELEPCDVCVVGGGPVGIAVALACEERGLSVVLLESGHERANAFAASLSTAHLVDEQRHAPTHIAICRGLGGTSRWWGGRCVPFDQVDFAIRPHVPDAVWPITHREMSSWYDAAAAFFGIGPARFSTSSESLSLGDQVRTDQLERWTADIDAGRRNRTRLVQSTLVTVVLGATVTEFNVSDDGRRVLELTACDANRRRRFTARSTVLCCGGLETTRLLLVAQQKRPGLLGSALGRFYMGHASGKIADIVLAAPDTASAHDFFLDEGVYARRRFTLAADVQQRERLLNIAFWLDNPPFHNAAHRSGILSLVWMALAIPPIGRQLLPEAIRAIHVGPAPHGWRDHLLNVVRSPLATLQNLTTIVRDRFLAKPRRPGFLIRSAEGRYALHFLAEQAPNGNSRVSLSDNRDALGLPFLAIDIRFSEADARSVVRAHEILDRSLRESGYGRLDYHVPAQERVASVLRQAKDGFHQIGTTRMGVSAEDSVVDADCRVHGIENLYVASSSVFVSSSHANPTFSAVALALRLAAHLSENARAGSLEVAA
ncbi:MAG TPA: GMC family oxidoreductase [Bradyrhizobium sp.]|nr:GMC family oxidoreductase [Bradyrhizobium sp.]